MERLCGCSHDQTTLYAEKLAGATGLEPAASCVTGHSPTMASFPLVYFRNRISYRTATLMAE